MRSCFSEAFHKRRVWLEQQNSGQLPVCNHMPAGVWARLGLEAVRHSKAPTGCSPALPRRASGLLIPCALIWTELPARSFSHSVSRSADRLQTSAVAKQPPLAAPVDTGGPAAQSHPSKDPSSSPGSRQVGCFPCFEALAQTEGSCGAFPSTPHCLRQVSDAYRL